jgi:hypothetical protein
VRDHNARAYLGAPSELPASVSRIFAAEGSLISLRGRRDAAVAALERGAVNLGAGAVAYFDAAQWSAADRVFAWRADVDAVALPQCASTAA